MTRITVVIEDDSETFTFVSEKHDNDCLTATEVWEAFLGAYKGATFQNPVKIKIKGMYDGPVTLC